MLWLYHAAANMQAAQPVLVCWLTCSSSCCSAASFSSRVRRSCSAKSSSSHSWRACRETAHSTQQRISSAPTPSTEQTDVSSRQWLWRLSPGSCQSLCTHLQLHDPLQLLDLCLIVARKRARPAHPHSTHWRQPGSAQLCLFFGLTALPHAVGGPDDCVRTLRTCVLLVSSCSSKQVTAVGSCHSNAPGSLLLQFTCCCPAALRRLCCLTPGLLQLCCQA